MLLGDQPLSNKKAVVGMLPAFFAIALLVPAFTSSNDPINAGESTDGFVAAQEFSETGNENSRSDVNATIDNIEIVPRSLAFADAGATVLAKDGTHGLSYHGDVSNFMNWPTFVMQSILDQLAQK